jgi:anti-anti-sigma factor
MSEPSSIRVETINDVAIVTFRPLKLGDHGEIQKAREEVVEFIQTQQPVKMIVDLGQVRVISSEAINVLMRMRDELAAREGQLRLCNLPRSVMEVLRITDLTRLFEIRSNVAEAFRELASRAD